MAVTAWSTSVWSGVRWVGHRPRQQRQRAAQQGDRPVAAARSASSAAVRWPLPAGAAREAQRLHRGAGVGRAAQHQVGGRGPARTPCTAGRSSAPAGGTAAATGRCSRSQSGPVHGTGLTGRRPWCRTRCPGGPRGDDDPASTAAARPPQCRPSSATASLDHGPTARRTRPCPRLPPPRVTVARPRPPSVPQRTDWRGCRRPKHPVTAWSRPTAATTPTTTSRPTSATASSTS